jgi:hypothetical protein
LLLMPKKEYLTSDRNGNGANGRFCRDGSCVHDPVCIFASIFTSFIDRYRHNNNYNPVWRCFVLYLDCAFLSLSLFTPAVKTYTRSSLCHSFTREQHVKHEQSPRFRTHQRANQKTKCAHQLHQTTGRTRQGPGARFSGKSRCHLLPHHVRESHRRDGLRGICTQS